MLHAYHHGMIGIFTGFIVMAYVCLHKLPIWTAIFLLTTILTSVTGFLFPITVFARRRWPSASCRWSSFSWLCWRSMSIASTGGGGSAYVATALAALYLNCLCLHRAELPEGDIPSASGAETSRTALRHHTDCRAGDLRRSGRAGRVGNSTPNGVLQIRLSGWT